MIHQLKNITLAMVIPFIACTLVIMGPTPFSRAGCVFNELADTPLDAKINASPGIIMFLLDDSGSMSWTMSLTGVDEYTEENGVFDKNNDNDYNYSCVFDVQSGYDMIGLSRDYQMYWKTQSSIYNKLYYNPDSTYIPWPGKVDVDPDIPVNPHNASDTINLNSIYYNFAFLDQSEITNAVGAFFVDNSDINLLAEFIVDDGDPGFSTYDDSDGDGNADNPKNWGRRTTGNANGDDYERLYYNNPNEGTLPFRAVHSFNLPADGSYEIFVKWIIWDARGTAKYSIHRTGETDISSNHNQSSGSNGESSGWVSLGIHNFVSGAGNAAVSVNYDGTDGTSIDTDAVRLVPQFTIPQNVLFQSTGPKWSEKSGQYASNAYLNNYLYTNQAGDYTATWTSNLLNTTKNYNVYVRWKSSDTRSQAVKYNLAHDGGTETKTFNQQENSNLWVELAKEVSFSSGTGVVTLEHSTNSADEERACADAVVFVPSDQITSGNGIRVANSHYYVKGSDNEIYLVNMKGSSTTGSFEYYKVDHTKGTDSNATVTPGGDSDKIVDLELIKITSADAVTAGIVTTRTYAEERQNFANWFSYYRKRLSTAKNAIANVINSMSQIRIGILGINAGIEVEAQPIKVTLDNTTYDYTDSLLTSLYNAKYAGATPLRQALERAGNYFEGNDSLNNNTDKLPAAYFSSDGKSKPFFKEGKGGECGQAFCILMTDGYSNGNDPLSVDIKNNDKDDNTPFDGGKFSDEKSDTLADVAMYFYERDLNTSLSNSVPTSTLDKATHQHMITYGVGFGVTGQINPSSWKDCPIGDCPPKWWVSDPNQDASLMKVDDLYHASVNGRGEFISASTPEELAQAMKELQASITGRLGSAAAAATNSIQVKSGTKIYQGTYNSNQWSGNVVQLGVDPVTGAIGSVEDWASADLIDSHNNRIILTYNGTSGVPFNVITNTPPAPASQNILPDYTGIDELELISYLRGDHSLEISKGGSFRDRTNKLGDVVHSAPYFYDDVIYVGANDGMLHAFNKADGTERFAYVPKIIIDAGNLPTLASTAYTHKFFVDNTVHVQKIYTAANASEKDTTLVVGGLRKGGKGYFCLDVNGFSAAPVATDASSVVKWEYTATGDNDLGYSYSRAYITKTKAKGWVVIFGNGYDSVNQKAVLYILDIDDKTGAFIKEYKIDTDPSATLPTTDCNGLASPAIIDYDFNGNSDLVYAGDLNGNLWKFDISGSVASEWKVAYGTATPEPLITVKNKTGYQPITLEPNVMKMECDSDQKGYMIFFGSGQYMGDNDVTNTDQQSFYGIWDWQDEFGSDSATKYLGEFNISADTSDLSNASATLLRQKIDHVYTNSTHPKIPVGVIYRIMSDNPISWYKPFNTPIKGDHVGWYFNADSDGVNNDNDTYIDEADELISNARIIQDPLIRPGNCSDIGIVTFISSFPSLSDCGGSAGDSWLYQVSACNGGMTNKSHFDTNGDGFLNDDDLLDGEAPAGKHFGGMLYKPIQVGPNLYINDSSESPPIQLKIPKNMEGMFYWQQLNN